MSGARIAFLASALTADLTEDDRLALAPLEARGIEAVPAVWTDSSVRWEEFALVVVRSPWDYYFAPDEFLAWLAGIEARSVRMANPPSVIRWNIEKSYLRALHESGVPVVPTAWVERGADATLAQVLRAHGWERSVVKPALSASAHETWVVGRGATDGDEERFRRIAGSTGVMVQPFMEQIETEGELSFIFLEGKFSHAVVKRPARGDFRVQSDFGGTVESADPPGALVDQAAKAVRAGPGPLLYARVDGVVEEGRLLLMELELFEPALFLHAAPGAPGRFADAVARLLSGAAP